MKTDMSKIKLTKEDINKMVLELTKADWEANRFNNVTLIKTNLMQIEMAKKIILLCEEKIKEFPEEDNDGTTQENE